MSRPRKYPQELIDRGIRMVFESGRPIAHVAADLGLPAETLRKRVLTQKQRFNLIERHGGKNQISSLLNCILFARKTLR